MVGQAAYHWVSPTRKGWGALQLTCLCCALGGYEYSFRLAARAARVGDSGTGGGVATAAGDFAWRHLHVLAAFRCWRLHHHAALITALRRIAPRCRGAFGARGAVTTLPGGARDGKTAFTAFPCDTIRWRCCGCLCWCFSDRWSGSIIIFLIIFPIVTITKLRRARN